MRVSGAQLARLAGVSRESVRKARESGRIEAGPDGKFDAEVATAVLVGARAAGGLPSVAESRQAAEAFKARLAKLELDKREGTLVEFAAVEREWSGIAGHIRNTVLNLPERISNRVRTELRAEVLAAAQDETRAVLTELGHEIRATKQTA